MVKFRGHAGSSWVPKPGGVLSNLSVVYFPDFPESPECCEFCPIYLRLTFLHFVLFCVIVNPTNNYSSRSTHLKLSSICVGFFLNETTVSILHDS